MTKCRKIGFNNTKCVFLYRFNSPESKSELSFSSLIILHDVAPIKVFQFHKIFFFKKRKKSKMKKMTKCRKIGFNNTKCVFLYCFNSPESKSKFSFSSFIILHDVAPIKVLQF